MPMSDAEFRTAGLREAVKKLFERDWFCVSDFKSICELAKIHPPKDLMQVLQPLHCRHWSDMDETLRDEIAYRIFKLLGEGETFCLSMLDEAPDEPIPALTTEPEDNAVAVVNEVKVPANPFEAMAERLANVLDARAVKREEEREVARAKARKERGLVARIFNRA